MRIRHLHLALVEKAGRGLVFADLHGRVVVLLSVAGGGLPHRLCNFFYWQTQSGQVLLFSFDFL
jgi:hypothetical protein